MCTTTTPTLTRAGRNRFVGTIMLETASGTRECAFTVVTGAGRPWISLPTYPVPGDPDRLHRVLAIRPGETARRAAFDDLVLAVLAEMLEPA